MEVGHHGEGAVDRHVRIFLRQTQILFVGVGFVCRQKDEFPAGERFECVDEMKCADGQEHVERLVVLHIAGNERTGETHCSTSERREGSEKWSARSAMGR